MTFVKKMEKLEGATSEFRRRGGGRLESVTRSGNRVTNALVRTSFVSSAKERVEIKIYIRAGLGG